MTYAAQTVHCEGDYRRVEQENARFLERIEQLEYELEHWKREAAVLVGRDKSSRVQALFKLSEAETLVAGALYQRRGKALPVATLEAMLEEERGYSLESSVVSVLVAKLRQKIGKGSVINVRGCGYYLDPACVKRIDEALGM